MPDLLSRRSFLAQSIAGSATIGAVLGSEPAPESILPAVSASPNEKIALGFIGLGGMGSGTLNGFLDHPDVDVLAVCDVYDKHAGQAREKVEKVRGKAPDMVKDFRELIDRKDIDAVVVSTPDHWHAITSISACMAGKDVYCEKPLTYCIAEGQAMVRAARSHKRVTQMGTQIHAGENYHRVVEIVRSGGLGKIHQVRVWIAGSRVPGLGHPPDSEPFAGLDWDMWLGPAPQRPFNPNRFLFNFRWFWDYAGGVLSDMGCHVLDLVHWAMQVDAPSTIASSGHRYVLDDNAETPDTQEVVYEYPGFNLVWSHMYGSSHGFEGKGLGIMFHGTNGTLVADYGSYKIFPEQGRMDGFKEPPVSLPRSPGHHREFLNAIRSRQLTSCDWSYGHRLTSVVHLGNLALKTAKKIRWDGQRELCVDSSGTPDAEANRLLTRSYRAPWKLRV